MLAASLPTAVHLDQEIPGGRNSKAAVTTKRHLGMTERAMLSLLRHLLFGWGHFCFLPEKCDCRKHPQHWAVGSLISTKEDNTKIEVEVFFLKELTALAIVSHGQWSRVHVVTGQPIY